MSCNNCGTENEDKTVRVHDENIVVQKNKMPIWLTMLLWLCFLPIMAIITIAKNQKLSQKAKIIWIAVIVVVCLVVCVVGMVAGEDLENESYEAIINAVDSNNYKEAQNLINDFLKQYPNSQYTDEIKAKKEFVDARVLKEENANKAGISVNAFENMVIACESIGIEYSKVSNITSNGDCCSFDYSGYSFLVSFKQDETVSSISSDSVRFYENGQKLEDVNNRLITVEEKVQLKSWTIDKIKSILKAPSTAEFPGGFFTPFEDWNFSKNGTKYTVSSYVDSQNGFGAIVRSQFTIIYEWEGETAKITSLVFDGEKII